MSKKLDTKLFSNGAEFLVLSKLLLTNIQSYKAYVNFEGYDLVAVNPIKNKSAKIQVKSKNFKGDTSFYLNADSKAKSDFYVFAQTNSIRKNNDKYTLVTDEERLPMLYVMSYKIVDKYKKTDKDGNNWISLSKKSMPNIDKYLNDWDEIKKFLKMKINEI